MNSDPSSAAPSSLDYELQCEANVVRTSAQLTQVLSLLRRRTDWHNQQKEQLSIVRGEYEKACKVLCDHASILDSQDHVEQLFVNILTRFMDGTFLNLLDPDVLLQGHRDNNCKNRSSKRMKDRSVVREHHDNICLNIMEVLCPYELNGVCNDPYCKFWHLNSEAASSSVSSEFAVNDTNIVGNGKILTDMFLSGFRNKIGRGDIKFCVERNERSDIDKHLFKDETVSSLDASNVHIEQKSGMSLSVEGQKMDVDADILHENTGAKLNVQGSPSFEKFTYSDDFVPFPEIFESTEVEMVISDDDQSEIENEDEANSAEEERQKLFRLRNLLQLEEYTSTMLIEMIVGGHFGHIKDRLGSFLPDQNESIVLFIYKLVRNIYMNTNKFTNVNNSTNKELKAVVIDNTGTLSFDSSHLQQPDLTITEYSIMGENGAKVLQGKQNISLLLEEISQFVLTSCVQENMSIFTIAPILLEMYASSTINITTLYKLDSILNRLVKLDFQYKTVVLPILVLHISFLHKMACVHSVTILRRIESYMLKAFPFSSLLLSQKLLLFQSNLGEAVPILEYVIDNEIKLPAIA